MNRSLHTRLLTGSLLALSVCLLAGATSAEQPLGINSARITIAGTSNVHPYTASTTTMRVVRAALQNAQPGAEFWDSVLKPGVVVEFEIAIPAATLSSAKDGLDKNMHKALKVREHTDIAFRLLRFEATNTAGGARAIGVLRIAGVEREVAFDLKAQRQGSALAVQGEVDLLMTDYGITPPKAMLGMLKTDPKVKVTFEAVFAIALT